MDSGWQQTAETRRRSRAATRRQRDHASGRSGVEPPPGSSSCCSDHNAHTSSTWRSQAQRMVVRNTWVQFFQLACIRHLQTMHCSSQPRVPSHPGLGRYDAHRDAWPTCQWRSPLERGQGRSSPRRRGNDPLPIHADSTSSRSSSSSHTEEGVALSCAPRESGRRRQCKRQNTLGSRPCNIGPGHRSGIPRSCSDHDEATHRRLRKAREGTQTRRPENRCSTQEGTRSRSRLRESGRCDRNCTSSKEPGGRRGRSCSGSFGAVHVRGSCGANTSRGRGPGSADGERAPQHPRGDGNIVATARRGAPDWLVQALQADAQALARQRSTTPPRSPGAPVAAVEDADLDSSRAETETKSFEQLETELKEAQDAFADALKHGHKEAGDPMRVRILADISEQVVIARRLQFSPGSPPAPIAAAHVDARAAPY